MTINGLDMGRIFIFFIFLFSLAHAKSAWYDAKEGDDFLKISQRLKISNVDLQFYNPEVKRLKKGDQVRLPPFEYHKVLRNESYSKIAKKYGLNEGELSLLNRSKKIKVGEVIRLRKLTFNDEKILGGKGNQKRNMKKEDRFSDASEKTLKVDVKIDGETKSMPKPAFEQTPSDDATMAAIKEEKKMELYAFIRNKSFIFPAKGSLEEFYGLGDNIMNYGINFKLYDSAIYSSEAGVVNYVGNVRGMGRVILISHGGGIFSLYSGNLQTKLKKGQKVQREEIIGESKSNVFFGVYREGDPLNPFALLLN